MSYPFLLVPQSNQYSQNHSQTYQAPPFRVSQPVHTIPAAIPANNNGGSWSSATPGSSGHTKPFKAPAHKHAHHLHSIPPREKSTRTLIIDHLLWVHCRTRFAQARAELGMSDRTGGSSSPNYIHRERPENYEEEDEAFSDGEDVGVLRARSSWSRDMEEERLTVQDLQLAKALRTRSESVEKVVDSMLNQPPQLHPLHPDDLLDSPNSSKQNTRGTNSHPHTLPNGVRLRIALATLINDFFARHTSATLTQASSSYLPHGLLQLLPISAYTYPDTNSLQSQAKYAHGRPLITPSALARSLYSSGVDLSSTPTPRCSRHLHAACTVCSSPLARQQNGRLSGGLAADARVTGWQDGGGIGSGLAEPGVHGNLLRREVGESTNMVELLSRFLRLSALVAMELGSEAVDDRSSTEGSGGPGSDQQLPSSSPFKGKARANSGSTPSSPSNQRFPAESLRVMEKERMQMYSLRPSREWYTLCAGLITRAVLEGYMTNGWTGFSALEMLMKIGTGLSLRVNGSNIEVDNREDAQDKEEGPFYEFDPDDLPTLPESSKVLFPSLRYKGYSPDAIPKEAEEAEYELEMEERLARFYDLPPTAPDLSTHLEDLSWQYPTEPLERAALRFFEAIAKWRGKPELETYKKKPNKSASMGSPDIEGSLSMDSLVNSSPMPPVTVPSSVVRKPAIERYFLPPTQGVLGYSGGGPKRARESNVLDSAKRIRQNQMAGGM